MPNYRYDIIDGQRVERNVAVQYRKWAADFKRETGCDMFVSSGVRTIAEQEKGRADYLAGRTKVKWADPYESSHCEVGPSGPRALDIRDSGKDDGVTIKGTYRWNVAVRLGAKYGFTWGGWGVPASEGWHFENHVVKVGVYAPSGAAASVGKPKPVRAKGIRPADMLKWRWTGIQRMLKAEYGYTGRIDNIPGGGTKKAMRNFLSKKGYSKRANGWLLALKPIFNSNDVKAIQVWLKTSWGYDGAIDGLPGAGTHAAWDRAEAANNKAYARVK